MADRPERVQLTGAPHAIAHEPRVRTVWFADVAAYADRYRLAGDQRETPIKPDVPGIVAMGAHPLVPSNRL